MNKDISTQLKKNKGYTLFELLVVIAAIAGLLATALSFMPRVMAQKNNIGVQDDVVDIQSAAMRWKGMRSNYTGVSISQLCGSGRNELSPKICGSSNNAVGTNPYGGNYTIAANTNLSRVDITVTGVDPNYVTSLADKLAPVSVGRCTHSTGCASVQVKNGSITVTM